VYEHAVDGHGWVVVRARPIQVIETRNGHERVLPVADVTRLAIRQMALAAIAIAFLSLALIAFSRRKRHRAGSS
jgi:hypothetical protein